MRFFVKLRDLKPGEMSVHETLRDANDDTMPVFWKQLKPCLQLDDCWAVTVDLTVTVEKIVPAPATDTTDEPLAE